MSSQGEWPLPLSAGILKCMLCLDNLPHPPPPAPQPPQSCNHLRFRRLWRARSTVWCGITDCFTWNLSRVVAQTTEHTSENLLGEASMHRVIGVRLWWQSDWLSQQGPAWTTQACQETCANSLHCVRAEPAPNRSPLIEVALKWLSGLHCWIEGSQAKSEVLSQV